MNSMSRVISFVQHGDFKKSLTFMTRARSRNVRGILEKYGQRGVEALAIATPKETGNTAASWSYEIKMDDNGATLCWKNANIVDGVAIAVILQYGHGTRNGGYVEGTDYINPVTKVLFDEIAAELWREVRKA